MSREVGGPADKDGNEFEKLWLIWLALNVLDGKARSLKWEPLGPAGDGIEVEVEEEGTRVVYQAKIENGLRGKWSVSDLSQVLRKAKLQIESGAARFVFVSLDSCKPLQDLAERSHRCENSPALFIEYQLTAAEHRDAYNDLCAVWELKPGVPEQTRQLLTLLQGLGFHRGFWGPEEIRLLERHAVFTGEGDGHSICEALESFLSSQLRNPVHADNLREALRSRGHAPLDLRKDPSVAVGIERLRAEFERSLSANLVGGEILPRPQTQVLLNLLVAKNGPRLIIVHGAAGVGKSGVLLELSGELAAKGVPFLPLRLDDYRPEGSLSTYSRDKLELPRSPAHCLSSLAGKRRAVLLIDQLDAIRWTAANSREAWRIVREILELALSRVHLSVVVTTRTFDLGDNQEISVWMEKNSGQKLEVLPIEETQVAAFVEKIGGSLAGMSSRQKELLRNLLCLHLWTTLQKERDVPSGFENRADLMRCFWANRRRLLVSQGIGAELLASTLDELVSFLDREQRLEAPLSLLDSQPGVQAGLMSLNVLQSVGRGRVRFSHQSYLDFLIAERVLRESSKGGRTPIEWILASGQSLLRRDQLHHLLGLLRDQDPIKHLTTLRGLFEAEGIRFHLQHLALSTLRYVDLTNEEKMLVLDLLQNADWKRLVVGVATGSIQWFKALADICVIAKWLAVDGPDREWALSLCRMVVEQVPERIERLFEVYWNSEDPDWRSRIAFGVLSRRAQFDTERLFEWRLASPRDEIFLWIQIGELTDSHPDWAIRLLVKEWQWALETDEPERSGHWQTAMPNLVRLARKAPTQFTRAIRPLLAKVIREGRRAPLRLFRLKQLKRRMRWVLLEAADAITDIAVREDAFARRIVSSARVWRKRFSPENLSGHDLEGIPCSIVSPLHGRDLQAIPNDAWQRIVSGCWAEWPDGEICQGYVARKSHAMFAADFGSAATVDPVRFVRFALQFPQTTPTVYIERLFDALTPERAGKRTDLISVVGVEEVARVALRWCPLEGAELGTSFCRLVRERAEWEWPDDVITEIGRLATGSHGTEPAQYLRTGEEFDQAAFDSVRGFALVAIQALLFARPTLIQVFLPAIAIAVHSEERSVRIDAAEALLPLLNHDRGLSIALFLDLCDHPRDEVLGSHGVSEMILYCWWQDSAQIEPVVRRMAGSSIDAVAQKGCYWATIMWIGAGRCEDIARRSLDGRIPEREGSARALVALAGSDEPAWRDRAVEHLIHLFGDPDKKVISAISTLFRQDWVFDFPEGLDLVESFVGSSGFAHDPLDLLAIWSAREGALAPLTTAILAASRRLSGDLAEMVDDPSGHGSATPYYLAPILVRLFQEIQGTGAKGVEEQCLDALDAWLRAHPGKSFRLLDQLDK